MCNKLEYKGFRAKVAYDEYSGSYFGELIGIEDLITFECEYEDQIETEFCAAVDDYLNVYNALGKKPDIEG